MRGAATGPHAWLEASGAGESGTSQMGNSERECEKVGGNARRAVVRPGCLAGVLGLLVVLLLAVVPPAFGATGHGFVMTLSGPVLVRPGSVAVDRNSGEIFVGDRGTGMIDVYDSAGTFVTQFGAGMLDPAGVAVDEASGDIYVADVFQNAVDVFKPDGSGGYQFLSRWFGSQLAGEEFGEVTGVAVDNSESSSAGRVYVVDARDARSSLGVVDVFTPHGAGAQETQEGTLVAVFSEGKMERPNGVAVSASTGRVLVADSVKGAIYAYSPAGVLEEKLTGKGSPYGSFKSNEELGNVTAVAIEETSGDIYVTESERYAVSQYGPTGAWEGWVVSTSAGSLGEPQGVALSSGDDLYVADAGEAVVDVFGPGVAVPDVSTGKASKLSRTTALLKGTINGNGSPAKVGFQYGGSETLGKSTPSMSAGSGEETVSLMLEGLAAGATYYYRVVGENSNGANYGIVRQFTTQAAVAGVVTGPATGVEPEGATLTGALDPEGSDARYAFEWGTTAAYGHEAPETMSDAGSGTGSVEASTQLSGLVPNTLYHYRLVAENSFGSTYGADRRFTTSGPPRIESEPTSGIGHEEATVHARIDPDQLATSYSVEYGETTSYGQQLAKVGISAGAEPVTVSATLAGLKLGVTYHFRFVAENGAGQEVGPDQTLRTVASAPVDASFATGIRESEASLHALINPLGHDTTFYFQYGTESCQANPAACADVPLAPGDDIGAGETDHEVTTQLSGLAPQTTYYFRVLASNALGTSEGPEHTFVTAGVSLPDHRAWEMVTPPDKGSAPVEALTREGGVILASESGDALTYVVNGALGEEAQGNRSPEWQQVLASRGQSAWSSEDIATPNSKAKSARPGHAPEYQFFNTNLSEAVDQPAGLGAEPPLAPGVTQATIYLRDNTAGTFLAMVSDANTAPRTNFGEERIEPVAATPDLGHVIISSAVALTGAGATPGLYEWAAGTLSQVSVWPNGRPVKAEVELGYSHTIGNALSNDGSRIVWTTPEEESRLGHLYLRDSARSETVQLDAAQGVAEPIGTGTAQFQTASGDSSRVFFTDKQRLTPDSTAEASQALGKPDLYECEMVIRNGKLACLLTDLTVDHNEEEHANVQRQVLGTSEDGNTVYLIAHGVLASNQSGNGDQARRGANNLFELHYDGTEWSTRFIATLSGEDAPEWEGNRVADTAYLTARVSPNGRYLAFMSAASLTGYDNVDASARANGARDEEVYLYDSTAASLRCVSCNPNGERPTGVFDTAEAGEGLGLVVDRREVWRGHWLAGNIPGWTAHNLVSATIQSRYLSNEGRLYFNSPVQLVPAASNGKEDVYEYEPSGIGTCASASGGCVSLISSGDSDRESAFLEATPDGSNVFFLTESRLLPQDTDTAFDIYDARECSETSPCLTPPTPTPPGCTEVATCRPAGPAQTIPGGPGGSQAFSGPANIVASAAPSPKHQSLATRAAKRRLTRAQKLTRALKGCRKHHARSKHKRKACERHARKRYGKKHRAKKGRSKAAARSHTRNRSTR
jgi:phosphodiesterase/alkaline phosphatase D-like protein